MLQNHILNMNKLSDEVDMSTIRDLRKRMGLSQTAFGELLHVDQTTVSKWENGVSFPDLHQALNISASAGISLDEIYENPLSFGPLLFPVYNKYYFDGTGEISTDQPSRFQTSYRSLAESLPADGFPTGVLSDEDIMSSLISLKINGPSMEPRFCQRDIILVAKDSSEHDNQICAVCIEREPAQIYRISRHNNGISLLSANPTFPPIFVPRSEIEAGHLKIIGRVIELRAAI
jgi:repressor LexA